MSLAVLVAADLVRTVAVRPTGGSVSVLGLIVVARTLLRFAIDAEIDGVLRWRKRAELAIAETERQWQARHRRRDAD